MQLPSLPQVAQILNISLLEHPIHQTVFEILGSKMQHFQV